MKKNLKKFSVALILLNSIQLGVGDWVRAEERSRVPGSRPGSPGHPGLPSHPGQPPHYPPPPTIDTGHARNQGRRDGEYDGRREGRDRGPQEGRQDGQSIGYNEGFARCEREAREEAYQRGYHDGYRQGTSTGQGEGDSAGRYEGRQRGETDGRADGIRRADTDARTTATPQGYARGLEQANQSDASQQGAVDGTRAGETQAREKAKQVDYPRGRQEFQNEKFAEPVRNQDSFSQDGSQKLAIDSLVNLIGPSVEWAVEWGVQRFSARPDYRYSNPRGHYATIEENQAYESAYRSGYESGFSADYHSNYQWAYQGAYRSASESGCRDARGRSYWMDQDRGYRAGRDQGYRDAYRVAYDNAYHSSYQYAFTGSSEQAYRNAYDPAFQRYYEEARSKAYSERYTELYRDAYGPAQERKFKESYPLMAEQEYRRGRADEEKDFAERPVRLLEAEPIESVVNGLFEPGEALRLRVQLRNFSNEKLAGRDIVLKLEAYNSASAVISQAEAGLVRDLREKSVTNITHALEFRMNESSVGGIHRFKVSVFFRGRLMESQDISVNPRFLVKVELAEPLGFKDGLATPIQLRLTNQGNQPTASPLQVRIQAPANLLEIPQPLLLTESIAPGQSTVVEFSVIAHTSESFLRVPLAFTVAGNSGRRIGLLDMTGEAPVLNDYRIALNDEVSGLLHPGVVRIPYRITNVSSRLLFKGLELQVSFRNAGNSQVFKVIGPNPQFLMPLEKGESTRFVVPVLVGTENSGGTLRLELKEDGRSVVIHDVDFKKALN